jgi:hypothetical protein
MSPSLEGLLRGDAVDHHLVDRGAERGGKAVKAQEGGLGLALPDGLVGDPVQLFGGDAGLHVAGHLLHHLGEEGARLPHALNLPGAFQLDGHQIPSAARMRA